MTHLLDHPAFRRYWYPVARLDALADGPVARRLLGEELVVWSTGDGVAAALDRCPHRDARLSGGWTEGCRLVCAYHGWAFGPDGRAVHVPQLGAGAPIPPKAALAAVHAATRYGWVWVALDEPVLPIPELDEFGADGWRVIHEPESTFACTAMHLVDNNIDPAHIAWVHRASFGTPSRPEVDVPEVTTGPTGIVARHRIEVEGRPGELGTTTVRDSVLTVHGPALFLNRITYPDGVVHLMVKACTPETTSTTRQLQLVLRNDDEAARPAADIVAFDRQVWQEDRDVLERCWTDFRLDLTGNVHLRTDRASIEYRRWLAGVLAAAA